MSRPQLLQDRFDGGMKRDRSRDQLPKNAMWDVTDYLADVLDAPLGKRGGWGYEGVSLNSITGTATVPKRVFYAAFTPSSGNPQVLAWDNNGRLFDITNATDRGVTTVPINTPIIFRELVIWGDGAAAPKKYVNAGTISNLGGTPPTTARIPAIWKERVLFSGRLNTGAEGASIYFSAAGNAESWDTTNAVIQTNGQVDGIATLPNAIIVFHPGSVEKILGDTPPSSTNVGNLALQPLFDNVGIYEPTAYAVANESVYWADENGVYKTDGTSLVDLTDKGGIRTYWQTQIASSNSVALGCWRGYLWVSLHSSDTYVDFLVCDIEKKAWFRFKNIVAENFSNRYGTTDEFYFANRQTKFVGKLSTVFTKANQSKNDADGDPVLPEIYTRFYRDNPARKRVRRIYLNYDLRDALADNPTLEASYVTSPEATSYTSLPGSTPFTETTAESKRRQRLAKAVRGFALKFAQSPGSASTRIYSLEADVQGSEPSR